MQSICLLLKQLCNPSLALGPGARYSRYVGHRLCQLPTAAEADPAWPCHLFTSVAHVSCVIDLILAAMFHTCACVPVSVAAMAAKDTASIIVATLLGLDWIARHKYMLHVKLSTNRRFGYAISDHVEAMLAPDQLLTGRRTSKFHKSRRAIVLKDRPLRRKRQSLLVEFGFIRRHA